MVKLEDQVVSLPLAKRLKELGVKQRDALYTWYVGDDSRGEEHWFLHRTVVEEGHDFCAAFTVAELGEMLPPAISSSRLRSSKEQWFISDGAAEQQVRESFWAMTEADARAKMLIYLLEHNLINGRK